METRYIVRKQNGATWAWSRTIEEAIDDCRDALSRGYKGTVVLDLAGDVVWEGEMAEAEQKSERASRLAADNAWFREWNSHR